MEDRPQAVRIFVSHPVQDETLAGMEADAESPLLPTDLVPVDDEAGAVWLGDLDRPQVVPKRRLMRSPELALLGRERDRVAILEMDELLRLDVDDPEHSLQRARVRIAAGRGANEGEDACEPPGAVLVRLTVVADANRVDVDQRHVVHAPPAGGFDKSRVLADGALDCNELVDGHRRLNAGEFAPSYDRLRVQIDDRLDRGRPCGDDDFRVSLSRGDASSEVVLLGLGW